jgi:hypothetical protein
MFQKYLPVLRIWILLILIACAVTPAFAQTDEYRLAVNKIFGYSSGDQLRGTMNMYVIGPSNIQSVQFMIDGKVIGEAKQAPFQIAFQTGDYAFGTHDLTASIQTTDGRTVTTPVRSFVFATAEQEQSSVINIIGPILGIVVAVMVLGFAAQMLLFRNKFKSMPPGTRRNYGLRGGTICPRCNRPYELHWWTPHLFTLKFDRCDFCGKWAFVSRLSEDRLRAAEQKELESFSGAPTPVTPKSEEEKLREMLDQSKYLDK